MVTIQIPGTPMSPLFPGAPGSPCAPGIPESPLSPLEPESIIRVDIECFSDTLQN